MLILLKRHLKVHVLDTLMMILALAAHLLKSLLLLKSPPLLLLRLSPRGQIRFFAPHRDVPDAYLESALAAGTDNHPLFVPERSNDDGGANGEGHGPIIDATSPGR